MEIRSIKRRDGLDIHCYEQWSELIKNDEFWSQFTLCKVDFEHDKVLNQKRFAVALLGLGIEFHWGNVMSTERGMELVEMMDQAIEEIEQEELEQSRGA